MDTSENSSTTKSTPKAIEQPVKKPVVTEEKKQIEAKENPLKHYRERSVTTKYECDICWKYFDNNDQFWDHVKMLHKKTVECRICSKILTNDFIFKSHMQNVHYLKKCDMCYEGFGQDEAYEIHLKQLHKDYKKCDVCSKAFGNDYCLKIHMANFHEPSTNMNIPTKPVQKTILPRPDPRPIAKPTKNLDTIVSSLKESNVEVIRSNPRLDALMSTLKSLEVKRIEKKNEDVVEISEDSRKYQCKNCSYFFPTRDKLQNHIGYIHNLLICDLCDETFSLKNHLIMHMGNTHKNYFKCKICDKAFPDEKTIKDHTVQTHISNLKDLDNPTEATNEPNETPKTTNPTKVNASPFTHPKLFKCTKCAKQFSMKLNRLRHVIADHAKDMTRFECDICGKFFDKHESFKVHVTDVHMNRGPTSENAKKFKCNKCASMFSTQLDRLKHVASNHSDVYKDFNCDICKKTFTPVDKFKRHLQLAHSNVVVCKICNANISNSRNLKSHVKSIHKMFPCDLCDESFKEEDKVKIHLKYNHSRNHAKVFLWKVIITYALRDKYVTTYERIQ